MLIVMYNIVNLHCQIVINSILYSNLQHLLVVNKNNSVFSSKLGYLQSTMCVNPKLKANFPQFQNIGILPYLLDIIDLDHLSTKPDISNYVDVQDVKMTREDNMFNVMHLNVHSLTKKD